MAAAATKLAFLILTVAISCSAAVPGGGNIHQSCFIAAGKPLSLSLRQGSTALGGKAGRCAVHAPKMSCDFTGDFKTGDKVKLARETRVYHVNPKEADGTLLPAGLEGEVTAIVTDKHPEATPNWPLVVQFSEPKKFKMHCAASDLEDK
eukprot:CAMPEP_0181308406 /NCGR_PEP_ID=MMETSP1101-20121128/11445_1 /TAXON_ID=46948 /ORGANISM="Rhodomonas abbreviata, Strain Caron Lab Isolate" /LENGTH=148 /DNA_ID=CAMNT_0023414785 /DNA_START=171 /DNA_END=617 /DNA_ORIENTATION=-